METPTREDYQQLTRFILDHNTYVVGVAEIIAVLFGDGPRGFRIPVYTGDLRLCAQLFKAVPYCAEHFDQMKSVSCYWKDLVEHWSEIETLIVEDKDSDLSDLITTMVHWHSISWQGECGEHVTPEQWALWLKDNRLTQEQFDEKQRKREEAERKEREMREQEDADAAKVVYKVGDIVRRRSTTEDQLTYKQEQKLYVVRGVITQDGLTRYFLARLHVGSRQDYEQVLESGISKRWATAVGLNLKMRATDLPWMKKAEGQEQAS